MGIMNYTYVGDYICEYTSCKLELYSIDGFDGISYTVNELNPLVVFRLKTNLRYQESIDNFNKDKENLINKIKSIDTLTDFSLSRMTFEKLKY